MAKKFLSHIVNEGVSLVKGSDNNKFLIKGKFSECDVENANGRVYKKSLMTKQVEGLQQKIKDRQLLGELDHPEDRLEVALAEASHLITKLVVQDDGVVYGEAEVLDTPKGKILKCLYEAGIKLGISSRGFIPEDSDYVYENGLWYLPDDYELITFDAVLDPSCFGAFPVKESVRKQVKKIISESKLSSDFVSKVEKIVDSELTLICNFESLKSTLHSKEIIEDTFKLRTKRIGKQLQVFAKSDDFGLKLLANKIDAFLRVNEKISDFKFVYPKNLTFNFGGKEKQDLKQELISQEELTCLQNKINEMKDTIATLEAKKSFAYKLIQAYVDEAKATNESNSDAAAKLNASLEMHKRRFKAKDAKISSLKAKNEKSNELIEAFANRTTCSEGVIASLRDKYLQAQKRNVRISNSLKRTISENKQLHERIELMENILDELKQRYLDLQSAKAEEVKPVAKPAKEAKTPTRRRHLGVPKRGELPSQKRYVNPNTVIVENALKKASPKDESLMELTLGKLLG